MQDFGLRKAPAQLESSQCTEAPNADDQQWLAPVRRCAGARIFAAAEIRAAAQTSRTEKHRLVPYC